MVLASFLFCLLGFLLVGVASLVRSRGTTEDYYLASRSVHPVLAGLSAFATNNSGYMFIGVIGFTYTVGLPAIWLMVGWIVGDLAASLAVHRELCRASHRTGELSFAGLISRWTGAEQVLIRRLSALLTVVFLGSYAAAQLSAGGKALHSLFGWNVHSGAVLVAGIVVVYCLAGGLRASIWTDVAQAFVMLFAMGLLLATAIIGLGGPAGAVARLAEIPGYLDWFPSDLRIPGAAGMALFALGWLFAGVSAIGQPHMAVRYMALASPRQLLHTRLWYYSFFTAFYAMATGVGLLARIYLPGLAELDPELALPAMAQGLLPPLGVGLILAGVFAATMSTADSLLLSCSAALTHDLALRPTHSTWLSKGATLLVTALALGIAIVGPQSVFTLVILSWSTLASAFVPLLVVYARGHRPTQAHALLMMLTGPAIALLWRQLGWHEEIYEGMPGILAGLATFYGPWALAALSTRFLSERTPAQRAGEAHEG
ncbi:MAG: sodium/proline symporter [Proteobacteria bacterium]|nr:MAG: sodium/proline symporter [Pseudomonadota bacterium]